MDPSNELQPTRAGIVLLGPGGVGRALLKLLVEQRTRLLDRFSLLVDVRAVADSRFIAVGAPHLHVQALESLISRKAAGLPLEGRPWPPGSASGLEALGPLCPPGTIVVDCTAADNTGPWVLALLQRGAKVVLANKKPLTAAHSLYRDLTRLPHRIRWETTVGSCLPILSALQRIHASGDSVHRIIGTYSGTMGFLMTGLQQGRSFSALVREAHRCGYTEPDPREDLSGTDVARKALILARGIGWNLDLGDVEVEGLVPAPWLASNRQEFLEQCSALDPGFAARQTQARESGRTLRYVAELADGICRVGLRDVSADSPLGRLQGSNNLVEIHTHVYHPHPLVLQGRGNGVAATAAGILSDIVELAFTA